MSATRRDFLQSTAAVAAGLSGARAAAAQPPQGSPARNGAKQAAAAPVQVPKMRFGNAEISRLICGCNPFYGYAHFNQIYSKVMSDYFTPERVCEVLHRCNLYGINAFNYFPLGRGQSDLERFIAEGGKMHLIVQGIGEVDEFIKKFKPLSMYHHGELTDRAFQEGTMDTVKEWCKKIRDTGILVGVGTHKPEVIAQVEEEGWDVDFYAGCVYNRTRTEDEWKEVLNGELVEMQGECYLRSDPARMYKVMRQTRKPCFAFKIMAAGRLSSRKEADQAFQTAYESIKPTDGVFIGFFPRSTDEIRENAERVCRILAKA